ncbi:MAG: hypothetical protein AAF919_03455 [Pseudomonadota bacterium]
MSRGDTLIEVLLGWAVGLAVAGVIYGPIIAISQGAGMEGVLRGVTMTPTYLALSYTIGAMISVPLVVLGFGAAVLAGPHPARHPWRWAIGVALVGAALYALGDALVRGDLLSGAAGLLARPPEPVLVADATIVGVAVFCGTLVYCQRLHRRRPERGGAIGIKPKPPGR